MAAPLTPRGPASGDTAATTLLRLGDRGGERTKLQNQRVDFQAGYVSEITMKATGGTETEITHTDRWTGGVTLDLNKLSSAARRNKCTRLRPKDIGKFLRSGHD